MADNQIIRIALDAMGSDYAPMSEIEGVIKFLESSKREDIEFTLVGDENLIKSKLNEYNSNYPIKIHHAEEVVTMHDEATAALKTKKNSSIAKGINLHRNGDIDAFLSAGNTGAMMSTSTVTLGRIKGVSRPTIGTFFPTKGKNPALILDAGANVDCKPKFMFEFAVMGSLYFKEMFGIDQPRIGLLNIGEEESKGNELALETHKLLKESDLNFIGNIEGRDIFFDKADVIVCDGFTGNIILKFAESFLGFFKATLKDYANKSLYKKAKLAMFAPTLKDVFRDFDYQEHGGVPLLGVNGVIIIGHGSSSGKAVLNMIKRSIEIIEKRLNYKIEEALTE